MWLERGVLSQGRVREPENVKAKGKGMLILQRICNICSFIEVLKKSSYSKMKKLRGKKWRKWV